MRRSTKKPKPLSSLPKIIEEALRSNPNYLRQNTQAQQALLSPAGSRLVLESIPTPENVARVLHNLLKNYDLSSENNKLILYQILEENTHLRRAIEDNLAKHHLQDCVKYANLNISFN